MVGDDRYVEIFMDCPIEVCEQRDTKGLWAKARRGEIKNFTGVDAPYEAPRHPDLRIDSAYNSPELTARQVLGYLMGAGFVKN